MVNAPDKSVVRIKFVPVTLVMVAEQLEFAAMTRFVKLQRIVGGVMSRTMTVRVMALVLPLPSIAVYVSRLVAMTLALIVPLVVKRAMPEQVSFAFTPGSVKAEPNSTYMGLVPFREILGGV